MHPHRAARLLATLGGILLIVVFGLRALSMIETYRQTRSTAFDPLRAPEPPIMGHYTISADGKQVSFEQQIEVGISGRTGWFSMPVGGGVVSLGEPPKEDLLPFLLRSDRLFLLVGEGNSLTPGSPEGMQVAGFAHAPDRKAMAFSAFRPGGSWGLYVLYVTGRLDWLGDYDSIGDLAWSPDSQSLVFITPVGAVDQLFRVDRAGQNLVQITHDALRKSSPRWSPDGKQIAYLAARESGPQTAGRVTATPEVLSPRIAPEPEDLPISADIYLINADGTSPHALTQDAQQEYDLAWVSDGAELVYALRLPNHPQTAYLYALDPQSGTTRRVYPPLALSALNCPPTLPRNGSGTVQVTVINDGQNLADVPLLLRTSPQALPLVGQRSSGTLRAETIQVDPGAARVVESPVSAVPGLLTHLSVLINIGDPFPMDEQHCAVANTYLGLPNLRFLPWVIPLTAVGLFLCIPSLLKEKKRILWAAWAAVLLAVVISAAVESGWVWQALTLIP